MNRPIGAAIRELLLVFVCGATFAAGLTIAGMERPAVILGAFTISKAWDPRLPLMFAASLAVHIPLARWIRSRRVEPLQPALTRVDGSLVGGSVLFGLGWGLAGICPGPAFTAAFTGAPHTTTFIVGLSAGIITYHLMEKRHGHHVTA